MDLVSTKIIQEKLILINTNKLGHLLKLKKISYFAKSLQHEIINRKVYKMFSGLMFFFILFEGYVFAQNETMFSQTFFNPGFINPAYAGNDSSNYFNVMALNRTLFSGLENAPNTTVLNVNGPLNIGDVPGGINVSFCRDQAGYFTNPSFNIGYAYQHKLTKGSLGFGLSAGIYFSTLDSESWVLPDGSSDPALPTEKSKQSFDLGLGVYYSNNQLYAGLSVTHLIPPVFAQGDNAIKLSQSYYLMGGYKFKLNNPDMELRPSVLIQSDLSSFLYSLNAMFFYQNKYWIGLDYRINTSVGIIAGLNLLPELRLGYSYGYNTSVLSKFSGGNHEVMLTYRFSVYIEKGKQKYKSIRYL